MDNTLFFVEISDTMCDLENNVACKVLAKVGKLYDLVEEFSTFHHYDVGKKKAQKIVEQRLTLHDEVIVII